MAEFWTELWNPDIPFLRYSLLLALVGCIPFGVMGTFVVVRRISYIAGAIAHSVLGGVGVALYLAQESEWIPAYAEVEEPSLWQEFAASLTQPAFLGALAAAILSALIIGAVSLLAKEREDTIIGAVWVMGMSLGIAFLGKLDGTELESFIFGMASLQTRGDIALVAVLAAIVVVMSGLFYNKWSAVCFDPDFARLRGVHVRTHYLVLLCLVGLTTVALVSMVGVVLVIGLLTLPAATSGLWARRLWQMMLSAVIVCMLFVSAGFVLAYTEDYGISPSVIFVAGASYLLALGIRMLFRSCR